MPVQLDNKSSDPVLIVGCDLGHNDLTAMVLALQHAGKLEIVDCSYAEPGSSREDEMREFMRKVRLPEMEKPLPPASALPYYRRFERKRRAR